MCKVTFREHEQPILVEKNNVEVPFKDEVPSLDDILARAASRMLNEIMEHDRTMMKEGKP